MSQHVFDQSSTIATGSNPNAVGKQRQTPWKAAWILHSPWSPCHLLSCRPRDFSELTMLATTLRVAKQWCPPHIAASPNWRTGIAADHKVGSGFMGWDCEGWKHHGFLRPLALMQIFPRIWNCILMNFIVLVTLTQIGTTKCERMQNCQIQCSQCDAVLVGRIRLLLLWGLSTRPVRGSKMRDAVRCACRGVLIASESSPLTFMDYFMDYTWPHYMSSNSGQMGWATHFSNSLCVFTSLQVFPWAVFDFGYFTAAY